MSNLDRETEQRSEQVRYTKDPIVCLFLEGRSNTNYTEAVNWLKMS